MKTNLLKRAVCKTRYLAVLLLLMFAHVHAWGAASTTGYFKKVTASGTLAAGDTVILVNTVESYALQSISTTSTKYGTLTGVSATSNVVSLTSANVEMLVLEAGYNSVGFSFKGTSNIKNNYLYWGSGNSLNKNSTKSANTSWTITWKNDGTDTIKNNSDLTRRMRFNSDRFACYTTNTGTFVQIYKKAYKVTYNGNGNTGGSVPTDNDYYYKSASVTTKTNSGTLAKTGYTFSGWNTKADGSGDSYAISSSMTMPAKDVILYAKWESAGCTSISPTLSYASTTIYIGDVTAAPTLNKDGSTGSVEYTSGTPAVATVAADGKVTALTAGTSVITASIAAAGGKCAGTATRTITVLPKVTLNAGTGSFAGASVLSPATVGGTVTLPSASPSLICSSDGWSFAGWCTSSAGDASENTTNPGTLIPAGSYTPSGSANTTLYAVYTKSGGTGTVSQNYTIAFKDNGSDSQSDLTTSTFTAQVSSGASNISSVSSVTKCYAGTGGIKMASGKYNGTFTLTLANSNAITGVTLNTKKKSTTNAQYGVTVGSTGFSTSSTISASDFVNLEFTGTKTTSNSLTISSTSSTSEGSSDDGRVAWLASITVYEEVTGTITYYMTGLACTSDQKIYLKDNANWRQDGAKYAVYYWDGSGNGWSSFMTSQTDCESTWKTTIPDGYTNMKFVRFNPGDASPGWNGEGHVYNETGNLTIPDGKDCFTLPDGAWNGTENGTSNANWSAYAQKITVSFDKNTNADGVTDPADQCVVKTTGHATAPTISNMSHARMGYALEGWFTAADGGTQWNFETGTFAADQELHAHWTAQSGTKVYLNTQWSGNSWLADEAVVFAHYWIDGTSQAGDVLMTANPCHAEIMEATIPYGVDKIMFVRNKKGTVSIAWEGDNYYNKTGTLDMAANYYYSITDWNSGKKESSEYSPSPFTITYHAGTTPNQGGAAISGTPSAGNKSCGTPFTLPSAQYSVTGYMQTGWTTSDGGAQTHTLGGSYATEDDEDFYPVWTANSYTITLDKNGAATDGTASVNYDATALTSITPVTRVGHTLTGYWTADEGGSKVLNADGTFYSSAPAAYVNSGRWVRTSDCKLYAQWTNKHAGKVFDLVTDLSELGDGKEIVILGYKTATSTYYAMGNVQGDNNRSGVAAASGEFEMSNSNKTVTLGATTSVQVITLEETGEDDEYSLNVETGYLYAAASGNNYMRTQETNNTNSKFTFTLAEGVFKAIAEGSSNRPDMRFNMGNALFSCYAKTSGESTILVYVEHEDCDDTFDDLELFTTSSAISTVSGYNTATLSTTGGNGGSVSYSVSPAWGWSVVGNTFTATTAGTYTVTASQLKNGDKCRASSNSVTITATTPSLTKSETSLAFGESCTSHASELTFTLTGSNLLGNVTLTLGGTNPGDFSVTSPITPTDGAVSETVTVTCSPTATGSRSATLTIASTGVADQTIALSCTGIACYAVEWYAGDEDPYQTTGVRSGERPVFPSNPTSCESGAGKSTYFYGWATDKWSGKATDLEDSKLSGITIYRKASDMPAVSAAGTKYYAVWAKADGTAAPATYAGTGTFTKITSLDDLEVGAHYVLYGIKDADPPTIYGAMNNTFTFESTNKYTFGVSSVSISDNTITNPATTIVWTLGGTKDAYTVYSQNSSKYVEITSNDTRGYTNPSSATTSFTIKVSDGNFKIVSNHASANNRMITIYDASAFRAYSELTEGYTLNLYKYGTSYTFSNFMTNCCTPSGLAFDGENNYQTFVRQDIKGARGGNGSATEEQGKATLTLGYTTSSTGTCTVEVKKLSGGDKRSTSATGSDASNHTTISVDGTEKEVTFSIWTYGSTYPTNNGQGTYRIKLTQAADEPYCQTIVYYFVDVVLRDKFVDAVNGNTFSAVDGDGTAKTTPLESARDADKDDDCHETTRRLVGWVNEVDMNTWYGTGQDRTRDLDDKTANITAPGATITTTGSTWYAVWGEENE